MSGVLVIGQDQQHMIKDAIERAIANPAPLVEIKDHLIATPTKTLLLKDRKPGVMEFRKRYPPQHVMLGTYHAAISFEQQPAGLMRHLSVSSQKKGKVPGPEVMRMICEAFGFDEKLCKAMGNGRAVILKPARPTRVWVEEFAPGHHAINVVELVA